MVPEASLEETEYGHVAAGDGWFPCIVFGVGSRERHTMSGEDGTRTGRPDWGEYVANTTAQKYGAAPDETTTSAEEAYTRFPPRELRATTASYPVSIKTDRCYDGRASKRPTTVAPREPPSDHKETLHVGTVHLHRNQPAQGREARR